MKCLGGSYRPFVVQPAWAWAGAGFVAGHRKRWARNGRPDGKRSESREPAEKDTPQVERGV